METAPVTEGELAILEVIWERDGPTTREIAGEIYDKATDSKVASVQKLIERLTGKGYVTRDRSDSAHRFRALVSREDFLRGRLQGLADRHCAGALAPLVTTLLRSKPEMTPAQGAELRRLIDEIWPTEPGGQS